MKKTTITKKILIAVSWIIVGIVFMYGAKTFVKTSIKENCNDLAYQSSQNYMGFYITPDEKQTCQTYGITINAPVQSGK